MLRFVAGAGGLTDGAQGEAADEAQHTLLPLLSPHHRSHFQANAGPMCMALKYAVEAAVPSICTRLV